MRFNSLDTFFFLIKLMSMERSAVLFTIGCNDNVKAVQLTMIWACARHVLSFQSSLSCASLYALPVQHLRSNFSHSKCSSIIGTRLRATREAQALDFTEQELFKQSIIRHCLFV